MKRTLGIVVSALLVFAACEPFDEGGGGGGGNTTFASGFVFVRVDKNVYAADKRDYQSVIQLTTNGNNRHPSLSKDGKRVAYVHTEGASTVVQTVATTSGTTPTTVITSDTTKRNFKGPVFSPDGTKIAFAFEEGSTSRLGLVNADGTGFQALTPTTLSFGAPAFFADGTALIAAAGNTPTSLNQIQKVTLTGTTSTVKTTLGNEATAVVNRVVVSPDGLLAAFDGRVSSGVSRIFVFPITSGTGGNVTQLTDHVGADVGANDTFPAFVSASELAFGSDSGGADQLYQATIPFDLTTVTKTAGTLTVPSALEPWYGPN